MGARAARPGLCSWARRALRGQGSRGYARGAVSRPASVSFTFALLLASTACHSPPSHDLHAYEGQAFASIVELRWFDSADDGRARLAAEAALSIAADVERVASVWRTDSELSDLNRRAERAGCHEVSPVLAAALGRAHRWSEVTGGAFDPLVGAVLEAQGYYRGEDPGAIDPETLAGRLGPELWEVGDDFVRAHAGDLRFDLGGMAKGWAVDEMVESLSGISGNLAVAGGPSALRAAGPGPDGQGWPFEVELDRRRVWMLRDEAVAVSRKLSQPVFLDGKLVSHLIDPRRVAPVEHATLSAVVRAETAEMADVLATAVLVLGTEAAREWLCSGLFEGLNEVWTLDVEAPTAERPRQLHAQRIFPGDRR